MPRRGPIQRETPALELVQPIIPADLPPSPGHLSETMQAWWTKVVADYDLDAHHLKLLEAAADAWDRMSTARAELLRDGLTVKGRYDRVPHPAVNIERDSRLSFARLVRELDLDADPPLERAEWRPPSLRSNRRR
jgi:phage terminase small subunit